MFTESHEHLGPEESELRPGTLRIPKNLELANEIAGIVPRKFQGILP